MKVNKIYINLKFIKKGKGFTIEDLGNNIGMGAMGFVGNSMVIDCNIEVGFCHTGAMQMSMHAFCLSSRRAVARIYGDGKVVYRNNPKWFTDYQRRETVEWIKK